MPTLVRKLVFTVIPMLVVLTSISPARAVQIVDACGFECTTDCELGADLICPLGIAVALYGGSDLDLKGHHLICENPSDPDGICSGPAVTMFATASVVKDTGATKGGIIGPFAKAVECNGWGNSRVTGIAIDGVDGNGTLNCATVDNNVIVSRDQLDYVNFPAITTGIASSIHHNYVGNFIVGIVSTGTKVTSIDSNVIEGQSQLGGASYGNITPTAIDVFSNSNNGTSVTNNSIIGVGGGFRGRVGPTYANNRCDEASPSCLTCIASGYCAGPSVPYCLDRTVTLRPIDVGDVNQFDHLAPIGVPTHLRWLLVDDFGDGEGVTYTRSSITNQIADTVKTELFRVGNTDLVPEDSEFQSCVLEAHMRPNGPNPVTTYLVVKVHGLQSDGPAISVASPNPILYTRAMPTTPQGVQWESDDLNDGTLQIGVKNPAGPQGVSVSDIRMRCQ